MGIRFLNNPKDNFFLQKDWILRFDWILFRINDKSIELKQKRILNFAKNSQNEILRKYTGNHREYPFGKNQ